MPIFSRRAIQRSLNEVVSIVPKGQLRSIVNALNLEGSSTNTQRFVETLAKTWEVVLLSTLYRFGGVRYERTISNGSAPDVLFANKDCEFLADVFAVSDDKQREKNPIDLFSDILCALHEEHDLLKHGSLDFRVGSIRICVPRPVVNAPYVYPAWYTSIQYGPIIRLKLPPVADLEPWTRNKLKRFFEAIQHDPTRPRRVHVDEPFDKKTDVEFTLSFRPGSRNHSWSHASHLSLVGIRKHVAWNGLLRKSDQFRGATEPFPRVVILCDSDCAGLKTRESGSGNSTAKLINYFWHRPEKEPATGELSWFTETDISAVLVLTIEDQSVSFLGGRDPLSVKSKLFHNPYATYPLDACHEAILERMVAELPKPIKTPLNALAHIKNNPLSTRNSCGFSLTGVSQIKISSVDLLKVLAGEKPASQFGSPYMPNPFKLALERGRSIKSVSVEPCPDQDFDQVTIELNEPDVALAPYQMPGKGDLHPRNAPR